MITTTIDHASLRQCLANLDSLPKKKLKPAVRKGVRAAARPIWAASKANAPRETGTLRRGLRVVNRAEKNGVIQSTVSAVNVKRKNGRNANKYAHFVEGGAVAHTIKPQRGKVLRFATGVSGRGKKKKTSYAFAKSVSHPGTKATHFLRRAAMSSHGAAVSAFIAKLREVAG